MCTHTYTHDRAAARSFVYPSRRSRVNAPRRLRLVGLPRTSSPFPVLPSQLTLRRPRRICGAPLAPSRASSPLILLVDRRCLCHSRVVVAIPPFPFLVRARADFSRLRRSARRAPARDSRLRRSLAGPCLLPRFLFSLPPSGSAARATFISRRYPPSPFHPISPSLSLFSLAAFSRSAP